MDGHCLFQNHAIKDSQVFVVSPSFWKKQIPFDNIWEVWLVGSFEEAWQRLFVQHLHYTGGGSECGEISSAWDAQKWTGNGGMIYHGRFPNAGFWHFLLFEVSSIP